MRIAAQSFEGLDLRRAACAAACFAALSAQAGDWTITPRFTVDETFTDNVLLVENGEQGDIITTVTPGISLRGESARLQSNVDYNLQQRFYADQSQLDGLNHQLQGDMNATLIKGWLYFDTNSRVSQQAINNRGRITQDNREGTGNQQDVVSYEMAPRIDHRFGSWAHLVMTYANQTVDRSGSGTGLNVQQGSSTEDRLDLRLSSGDKFGRFPVSVSYEDREVEFDSGRNTKLKRLEGQASYVWSRKFRFTASGGTENNSFQSASGQREGNFWLLGGTWTPSERTSVTGNWGDRFFGKTFNVSASHRHRRLFFSLNYDESVRTNNQSERDLLLVPLLDAAGEPVFDPISSSLILVPLDTPTLTDDTTVEKRLNASVTYEMRLSTLSVSYFENDRTFQAGGNDELTRGATVNFSRSLSPRLNVAIGLTWRENERSGDASKGSFHRIFPSLNYNLGPHTTLRVRYEHAMNDGGSGGGFGGGGPFFGGGFGLLGQGLGNTGTNQQYTENSLSAALVFDL